MDINYRLLKISILLIVVLPIVYANFPNQINIEGVIRSIDGNALVNGRNNISLYLINDSNELYYNKTDTILANGIFDVLFTISPEYFYNFLGFKIAVNDVNYSLHNFTSEPYAFFAHTANKSLYVDTNHNAIINGNLSVNSPTFFVDADADRVGIGTTSPDSLLTVSGGDYGGTPHVYTDLLVEDDDYAMITVASPSTGSGYYYFADEGANTIGGIGYDHTVDDMFFRVNLSTKMTIKKSGYVGIGTTNPASLLEVYGGSIKTSSSSNSGYSTLSAGTLTQKSGAGTAAHNIYATNGNDVYIALEEDGSASGTDRWVINNEHDDNKLQINNNGSNKVTITTDGRFGLGIVNTSSTLDVQQIAGLRGIQVTGVENRSAYLLHLKDGSGTPSASFLAVSSGSGTNDVFTIANTQRLTAYSKDDSYWGFQGRTASDTNWHGNFWDNYRSRGTHSSPTAVQADDYVFYFDAWGYDGTTYQRSARIMEFVDGAVSNENVPMAIKFNTGINTSNVSERMRIGSNGNIGIGTTSPDYTLDVAGNAGFDEYIYHNGDSDTYLRYLVDRYQMFAGNIAFLDLIEDDTQDRFIVSPNNNDIDFIVQGTAGKTNIFADGSSGNVGIGTTTPSAKLDISNGAVSLKIGADSNLDTRTDSTTKYGRIGSAHYLNAEQPVAVLLATASPSYSEVAFGGGSSLLNAAKNLKFYTAVDDVTTTGSVRMTIDNIGNVGIGTTSPTYELDIYKEGSDQSVARVMSELGDSRIIIDRGINSKGARIEYRTNASLNWTVGLVDTGDVTGSAGDEFYIGTTVNNPKLWIESNGNVGIGTTAPGVDLEIYKNGTSASLKIDSDTNGASLTLDRFVEGKPSYVNFETGGVDSWFLGQPDGGDYAGDGTDFYIGTVEDTPLFLIDTEGNVGIGTTNPTSNLQIGTNGVADTSFSMYSDTADKYLTLLARGNENDITSYGSLVISGDSSVGISSSSSYIHLGSAAASHMYFDAGQMFYFRDQDNADNVVAEINSATGAAHFGLEGGYVGIGTTSPAYALDVNTGDVNINATKHYRVGTDAVLGGDGSTQVEIGTALSRNLKLYAGNAIPRITIDKSTGNVGIGTTTPTSLLQVAKSTGTNEVNLSGVLYVNSTSGNVGIGTTNPTTQLHISSGASGGIPYNPAGGGVLTIENNEHSYLQLLSPSTQANFILFGDQTNNIVGQIKYLHTDDSMTFRTNGVDHLIIKSNGNVGIGETTPARKLHIHEDNIGAYFQITNNNTGETSNDGFQFSQYELSTVLINREEGDMSFRVNSTTEGIRIRKDGNVGIGTTNPLAPLHIEAGGNVFLIDNGGDPYYLVGDSSAAGDYGRVGWNSAGDYLELRTYDGGAGQMVLAESGNVGIGTTSPDQKLTVNGSANITGALYAGSMSFNELEINGGIKADSLDLTDYLNVSEKVKLNKNYTIFYSATDPGNPDCDSTYSALQVSPGLFCKNNITSFTFRLQDDREIEGMDCATFYAIFGFDGCWGNGYYTTATLNIPTYISLTTSDTKTLDPSVRYYDFKFNCEYDENYVFYVALTGSGSCDIKTDIKFSDANGYLNFDNEWGIYSNNMGDDLFIKNIDRKGYDMRADYDTGIFEFIYGIDIPVLSMSTGTVSSTARGQANITLEGGDNDKTLTYILQSGSGKDADMVFNIDTIGNSSMDFQQKSNTKLFIDETKAYFSVDNIGIGTNNPISKLQVNGTIQVGDGSLQKNITMTSPSGNEGCCGMADDYTWSCTAGACS